MNGLKVQWKSGDIDKVSTNNWEDLLHCTWQNQWKDQSFKKFRESFQARVTGWTGVEFSTNAPAETLYRALATAKQLRILEG